MMWSVSGVFNSGPSRELKGKSEPPKDVTLPLYDPLCAQTTQKPAAFVRVYPLLGCIRLRLEPFLWVLVLTTICWGKKNIPKPLCINWSRAKGQQYLDRSNIALFSWPTVFWSRCWEWSRQMTISSDFWTPLLQYDTDWTCIVCRNISARRQICEFNWVTDWFLHK